MIAVEKLLEDMEMMMRERWRYSWGKAERGLVDCSGALVWAFAQAGERIYHGSNRMARVSVRELLPIAEAKPGMAAFKRREASDRRYSLPGAYRKGGKQYNGDLGDYYHVGIVDASGRYVLNAQSAKTGFVRSPISQRWCCAGYLRQVTYEKKEQEEENGPGQARVESPDGNPVKLRAAASKESRLWWKVPAGSMVEVLQEEGDWWQVRFNGRSGWMQKTFLHRG